MKIDIFNHLFPQAFFDKYIENGLPDIGKRVKAMPTIVNLDARFKVMDEFGDYCQVISLPAPTIEALGGPNESPDIAKLANDGMAELCQKYPQRFPAFIASLPMNNPEATVKEAVRAIDTLGASGVQIYTNVNGAPLDGPELAEFFRLDGGTRDRHLDASGARRKHAGLQDGREIEIRNLVDVRLAV
ncbi:MAG: amidohydrolase family protein [Acidobacteriota bacterium]